MLEQFQCTARRSMLDIVRALVLLERPELRDLCLKTQWQLIEEGLRTADGTAWLRSVGLDVGVLPLLGDRAGTPQQLGNAAAREFEDAAVERAVAAMQDARWDALLQYALRR